MRQILGLTPALQKGSPPPPTQLGIVCSQVMLAPVLGVVVRTQPLDHGYSFCMTRIATNNYWLPYANLVIWQPDCPIARLGNSIWHPTWHGFYSAAGEVQPHPTPPHPKTN